MRKTGRLACIGILTVFIGAMGAPSDRAFASDVTPALAAGSAPVQGVGGGRSQFENLQPDGSRGLRHFNIESSPMALLARRYNLSFEIGASRSLSLGIKGTNYNQSTSWLFNDNTGYEVGLRSTWYPFGDRFTSGIIIRPSIYYQNSKSYHDFADAVGNVLVSAFTLGFVSSDFRTYDVVKGPVFELLGGYQWVMPTGFSLDWNMGLNVYQQYSEIQNLSTGSTEVYESKAIHVSPLIEVNIGYAF